MLYRFRRFEVDVPLHEAVEFFLRYFSLREIRPTDHLHEFFTRANLILHLLIFPPHPTGELMNQDVRVARDAPLHAAEEHERRRRATGTLGDCDHANATFFQKVHETETTKEVSTLGAYVHPNLRFVI